MMKNHGSICTIDTVTKTHKPMLYRRVDHLKRMQDRLTTNMLMMQDLLAAHMMRTTSLANSSSPCPSLGTTTMLTPDGWRVVDDDDYRQAVGEPQA
jgi:hypothetical protein